MGETTHDAKAKGGRKPRNTNDSVRPFLDERVREDRTSTDGNLREERLLTDELLSPEQGHERVAQVVRESEAEAEKLLREVRADSDQQLKKQADGLPQMSEKLEQVAESLSKATASLTGVVELLQEDLITEVAQIAEDLRGTPESASAGAGAYHPAVPEASGTLAGHLSEIAEGIAEITSTLSEERRDADQSLREERSVTDLLIGEELKQVQSNLRQELRQDRQAILEDRQATDESLANERRNTDDAVEHVQALLTDERQDHAHTARSLATRNEFLGIVSHDLRGPLMTIAGVAALMDRQAPPDEIGQRMRAWAARVRRSVNVMERLIGDLLDFSSFEDGQLRVAAERLDIRSLVRGAIDAFQGIATAKNLSLEADLPEDPLVTQYDPHRMLQVLSNLIQNAIKFTPEGGSIRIRAVRAGAFSQVSVCDTGVGIPESDLTEIFERFRQLNPSDHTGLGLGLYISQWIVEAHGGRIWAESHVGAGATLHFTLPGD